MIQQIRQKAKALLESGQVECVIGYETGTDGVTARPVFVYQAAETERLVFDNTCTHNLVKYLLNRKGKSTAIVAKPCDARAINVLLGEKQLQREKIFVIGVVCSGVVEARWGQPSDRLQARCESCRQHTPPIYDFLVGEPVAEEPLPATPFPDMAEMDDKSVEERLAFWREQFERCIRCYACRAVCFGCYCSECFVEQLDPEWVGIRIAPTENQSWHAGRAFHLAGRCIACNECERVCPVDIPLSLLNHKLEEEVLRLFDFQAGLNIEPPPLATFRKEEKLGVEE